MLVDIHCGIIREEKSKEAIVSATKDWSVVHELRNCKCIWDVRQQGYALGDAEYVSYVDDDDIYLNIDFVPDEIRNKTDAFWSNSLLTTLNRSTTTYLPLDFEWSGIDQFFKNKPAHNPYFVKREIVMQAMQNAYDKILKPKQIWNNGVDIAIAFEVQLLVGWKYIPVIGYHWRQSPNSDSIINIQPYREVFCYYANHMK